VRARYDETESTERLSILASLLAFQGGILVPSYAASKGAVAQITKIDGRMNGPKDGITINAIAPGYMATNNTTALRQDEVRIESNFRSYSRRSLGHAY